MTVTETAAEKQSRATAQEHPPAEQFAHEHGRRRALKEMSDAIHSVPVNSL